MLTVATILSVADTYLSLSDGLRETTLSYRVFGDTKKLGALRGEADITVGRFNAAMQWFAVNWPADQPMPAALVAYRPTPETPAPANKDAA